MFLKGGGILDERPGFERREGRLLISYPDRDVHGLFSMKFFFLGWGGGFWKMGVTCGCGCENRVGIMMTPQDPEQKPPPKKTKPRLNVEIFPRALFFAGKTEKPLGPPSWAWLANPPHTHTLKSNLYIYFTYIYLTSLPIHLSSVRS